MQKRSILLLLPHYPTLKRSRFGWKCSSAAALLLLATTGLCNVAAAADLDGQWARGDGNARVAIKPCGSDICAINTWIKPGTKSEKTGDRLVMSIKPSENGQYAGTAFDPQRNMNYRITVTVRGDTMTTRGCVVAGLLCKSVNWTRLN